MSSLEGMEMRYSRAARRDVVLRLGSRGNRRGLRGSFLIGASAGIVFLCACGDTSSPGAATSLAFSSLPTGGIAGANLSPAITVTVQDKQGNTATSWTGPITIAANV